ncbi:trihelix transcription factor ASR3 [Aristolochia californica]|uniref:trihelix transcription factor ASR3 n=1 Tax=Aristolochia californica TaxID=171875 RepID=UPI0035E2298C
MEKEESPVTLETPVAKGAKTGKKAQGSGKSNVVSRCTRSQVVPDWTVKEMLTFISEVAAVNEDSLKTLSSYQKWKIISDNCADLGVLRSSNQCRRKWDQMLTEYKEIRDWETQFRIGSYWCLESERKKEFGLPAFFNREVFGALDAFLEAHESESESEVESESEGLISPVEASKFKALVDSCGRNKKATGNNSLKANAGTEQIVAAKVQESARLLQNILRGDLSENGGRNQVLVGTSKADDIQAEFKRYQADELIKVFGTLVSSLHQLVELVK